MGIEIARLHDSVVAGQRDPCTSPCRREPDSPDKGWRGVLFWPGDPRLLGERLRDEIRKALKLPIIFFSIDIRDSFYLADVVTVQALQALGDLGEGRRLTNGRLWVARPIAYAIAQKYPTAIQFAMV